MARKPIPIAVQLYSVRKDAEADLPGVLKRIAQMGYAGVEFAGYYGHSAQDIRKLLDENKLKVAGTHIGIQTLQGDELAKSVEFNKIIGNRFLVVPGLKEEFRNSKDAWKRTAGLFNEISDKLKAHKMLTGYHNHAIEFTPLDGELPWDTFFGNTKKDVVMQVDTGNALHAGCNVVPFVEKYPGRALTVHLKEYSKTNDKALIGEGDVDWQKCFTLCETIGATEWYIVEQESYALPPMDCIDKCLQNLKKMLSQ